MRWCAALPLFVACSASYDDRGIVLFAADDEVVVGGQTEHVHRVGARLGVGLREGTVLGVQQRHRAAAAAQHDVLDTVRVEPGDR